MYYISNVFTCSPESLWVLNPQKLFKTLTIDIRCQEEQRTEPPISQPNYGTITSLEG